jgi:hypothetical protein
MNRKCDQFPTEISLQEMAGQGHIRWQSIVHSIEVTIIFRQPSQPLDVNQTVALALCRSVGGKKSGVACDPPCWTIYPIRGTVPEERTSLIDWCEQGKEGDELLVSKFLTRRWSQKVYRNSKSLSNVGIAGASWHSGHPNFKNVINFIFYGTIFARYSLIEHTNKYPSGIWPIVRFTIETAISVIPRWPGENARI